MRSCVCYPGTAHSDGCPEAERSPNVTKFHLHAYNPELVNAEIGLEFDKFEDALDLASLLSTGTQWRALIREHDHMEDGVTQTVAIYEKATNWARITLDRGIELMTMYVIMEKDHGEHRVTIASTSAEHAEVLLKDMETGNPDFTYYIKPINVY